MIIIDHRDPIRMEEFFYKNLDKFQLDPFKSGFNRHIWFCDDDPRIRKVVESFVQEDIIFAIEAWWLCDGLVASHRSFGDNKWVYFCPSELIHLEYDNRIVILSPGSVAKGHSKRKYGIPFQQKEFFVLLVWTTD